jgi:hypothetical protein
MDITFRCDRCSQNIVIDEAGAGLTVQCPECGQSLSVPKAAGFTAQSLAKEALPPTPSTDIPPMIPQSIPAAPVRTRGMSKAQIAVLLLGSRSHRWLRTACVLVVVGWAVWLISTGNSLSKRTQAEEDASRIKNSRTFTARFLRNAGGFLGLGSTWTVESSEDAENGFHSYAGGGYTIYVYPIPEAAVKGTGFVTGDRLTFRASFSGYERLERADGATIRVESWRPIEE